MKKTTLILLLILCISCIVGCSGSKSSSNSDGGASNGPTDFSEKEYYYTETDNENIPASKTFYVDGKTGSDSNPGTETSPWKTIQKAADTLTAGQKVYIKSGVYNERVTVKNSGTAGNHIIFSAYNNNKVIIDGTGIAPAQPSSPLWGGLFMVVKVNYIKVKGLTIRNSTTAGIYIEQADGTGENNIIIKNNYTYNTVSSGIGAWLSNGVTVDGNEVVLASNPNNNVTTQECLVIGGCSNFKVMNNEVHHDGTFKSSAGINVKSSDGRATHNGQVYNNNVHDLSDNLGIYVDAWSEYTTAIDVYNNRVYRCMPEGIALAAENGGTLENVNVYNNLVYDNGNVGIIVAGASGWGTSGKSHKFKNISIYNNTVFRNTYSGKAWGSGIEVNAPEGENIKIGNNIVYSNYKNINLVTTTNVLNDEATNILTDPKFVSTNSQEPNLALQGTSSAIGKASTAKGVPVSKYDFVERGFQEKLRDDSPDSGAYEYR